LSRIAPGLETSTYFYDERHFVLSDPKAGAFGPNIGIDGRNLTIAFLSLNRATLSVRLIDSIEKHLTNFAGEVLIGDNGSDATELDLLRKRLARFPYRARILELGRNFGVAGGRNRIMGEAKTDWVISLDNDIYFTANPLGAIQCELATLGCHFMSFALLNPDHETLFSHGACLQTVIQDDRPRLTINPIVVPGSPAKSSGDGPKGAFLCTFLFGGASILNRHSFERLGGFDENMLIGFEDIDFSLRLFREGMKVGTSGQHFLVHDHPKAETATDAEYEKTRFSRRILYESARYLEAKTGFRIWGQEVENWMRSNEEKQGWRNGDAKSDAVGERNSQDQRRPRIALITDTDHWAFANISRQLKRYLSDRFDFEVIPLVTLAEIEKSRWYQTNCTGFFADGGAAALGMALLMAEDFDVIHVFWREFLTVIDTPLLDAYARRLGMSYPDFRRRFIENKIISTSVYDHLFLDEKGIAERSKLFTELTSGYYVCSERLRETYEAIPGYPRPLAVLSDGVDLTLFKPKNLERLEEIGSRPLRLGWVGHSGWASTLEDFKGVNTIFLPSIEQLKAEGLSIEGRLADRKERFIPHRQMPDYYAGIDVLVCTSKIEGTPNPVLEAMACGVPVITTDVGVVPQLLGPKQKEFVLPERSIEALKDAIRRLVAEPKQLTALSGENLESIKTWDWSQKAENFVPFFNRLLDLKKLESGELRTKMCMLPFSSPSMEPDGSIRLCSASSIFAYYDETNMGNCQVEGLGKVWTGVRYREVRRGLITGKDLKPYCATCEYRFDGPAWLMQLHLALHAYQSGTRSSEVLALIGRRMGRYKEYQERAQSLGLHAHPLPDELVRSAGEAYVAQEAGPPQRVEQKLAPEALIDCGGLPLYMDFNTLNRCNVTCTMCPPAIRYDKLGKKRDPYYRLTLDEYKKITEGVRIETAHFVGAYAEPLLNKEIFALIAHAKSRGAFTAITTNAMALSRQFGERLLDAGLDMMTISLHGATKEVAETIMEKSNFERVVANIRGFQALKKERRTSQPEIYINYVTQKKNVGDMPAFVDLAHELGIRFINFIHLIDGDSVVDKSENLLNHPELLIPNVRLAKTRAEELGVTLNISPAYNILTEP
jgi:MoaA/NifB/PqqE/SkfB family radical SAM enzyme/GT2 family glycosyltransferase